MRKSVLAVVLWTISTPLAAQQTTERFVQGDCWVIYEGFGQTKVLSINEPSGALLTTVPEDVVDVIQLFALQGEHQTSVVRIYELRDGTKFVCSLEAG